MREFSPQNDVVKLCIQGLDLAAKSDMAGATKVFHSAWNAASDDFERFLAAWFVGTHENSEAERLKWLERSLGLARSLNTAEVKAAFRPLYEKIGACYQALGDAEQAGKFFKLAQNADDASAERGPFFHGTKADLKTGDLLVPGFNSNYKSELTMNHIYFTALMNGAGLAAALAKGDGKERVYVVEPSGAYENDPNVTNKKFPGNPTRSYRTEFPLKVVGEVEDWKKQSDDELRKWRERLAKNNGEIIN